MKPLGDKMIMPHRDNGMMTHSGNRIGTPPKLSLTDTPRAMKYLVLHGDLTRRS